MPEGGAERDWMYRRPHNCQNAKAFRKALDDPDADMHYYNVGSHGEGMPAYTPFPVMSTNPCGVCGEYRTIWFEWKSSLIIALGR